MTEFADLVWGILGLVLAGAVVVFVAIQVDEYRDRRRRRDDADPPDEVGAP